MRFEFRHLIHLVLPGVIRRAAAPAVAGLLVACANSPVDPPLKVSGADSQQVVQPPGVEMTAELLYDILLGEIASQRGHVTVSVEALVRAAKSSKDPRVAERAAHLAVRAKQYDQALVAARLWRELQPDSRAPMELLGDVLLATGDLGGAEQQYREAIQSSGQELGYAYRRISQSISRYGKGEAAMGLMNRLVKLHPESAEAYYAKAYLADRLKLAEEANLALDRALTLKPKWEDAATAKVAHLIAQGKKEQAEEFSLAFLRANPKAHKLREQFARFLVDSGEGERALVQFKKLVQRDTRNGDALFTAGLLSIQTEQHEQAAEFLERHLELRPNNDQARLYLGQVAVELEQYAKAERLFRTVSQELHYFEAQLLLGGVIAKTSPMDSALKHLQSLRPSSEEERVRLVLAQEQILRESKELKRAKEVLDRGLSQLPDNNELLYARGLVAAQLSLIELHEQDLRRLLVKEPTNAHALNALGYTLADQTDRHNEALELITQALELRPDDPFILDSMGWVQYRLGNHAAAIDYLERALDTRADAEIAAHLGEVLWITGSRRRAHTIWSRALKDSPDSDVLLNTIRKLKQ